MQSRIFVCAAFFFVSVYAAVAARASDDDNNNNNGSNTNSSVHFDTGYMNADNNGYKEKTPAELKKAAREKREADQKKLAKSIEHRIKQLRSPDEDERAAAAEYLGMMNAIVAIPDLIECLNPVRKEKDEVMGRANGALVKITQKNYGVKDYEGWHRWWIKEKLTFAEKHQDDITELDRIATESANTRGLELMKFGDYRGAYNQFTVAISKDPKTPDYHNNAGLALLELGRPLDAIEFFNETINLNRDLPQPYMNIGRCYSRMDRSIEAQSWYQKAKDVDKDGLLWDIFWMAGKEYMKRNEYKLAYEYLDQARNKAEKHRIRDPRLYNDIAICHYCLDQYHSAWKEICNIRYLGYVPNADFEAKVRKVLLENGTDPDEEDALVRKHFAEMAKGDESAQTVDSDTKKEASIFDSLKLK